jgi:hypothetical protein
MNRSHPSRKRRAGTRRVASTLAAASAIVGAVQVAAPEPAEASACVGSINFLGFTITNVYDTSGYCEPTIEDIFGPILNPPPPTPPRPMPGDPPPVPQPTGPPAPPGQPVSLRQPINPVPGDVLRARDLALSVLSRDQCNFLLTGEAIYADYEARKAERSDARTVLQSVPVLADQLPYVDPNGQDDPLVAGQASMMMNGQLQGGQGAGPAGTIITYPFFRGLNNGLLPFFVLNPGETISRQVPISGSIGDTELTPVEAQAIAILHELAHLTNANDHGDNDPDKAFNRLILQRCFGFRIAVPGGGGGSAGTGNLLQPNQDLMASTSIRSANGQFRLTYQDDTNLVLYRNAGAVPLWATGFKPGGVGVNIMQSDGNLVIYNAEGNPVWASGTYGNLGSRLVVQDDGNLVIYRPDGVPIWASNTVQRAY